MPETWKSLFGGDDPFDFGTKPDSPAAYARQSASGILSPDKKKYHQDGKYRGQPVNNFKGKPTEEIRIGDVRILEELEVNGIIKDFDIRKAIIYTEIMTPKFKE